MDTSCPVLTSNDELARTALPTASELTRAAGLSGSVGNYSAGTTLWMFACESEKNPIKQVSLYEYARLSGCLPLMTQFGQVRAEDIVTALGVQYSTFLLAELALIRAYDQKEVHFLRRTFGQIPREILSNLSVKGSRRRKRLLRESELREVDLRGRSIWNNVGNDQVTILDSAYKADLPPLNALNNINVLQPPQIADVRAGAIIQLEEVSAWVASDLMLQGGDPLVDFYSWPGSELNNPRSDARILSAHRSVLRVKSSACDPDLEIDQAVWLAYPLSLSWGHWVRDILCRLVYLAQGLDLTHIPIIIDARVPQRFVEFALLLFPGTIFKRVEAGTRISATRLFVSPSRIFATHNPRWHLSGISTRVNAEPESFSRLRSVVKHLNLPLDSDFQGVRKVYLSRDLALLQRSLHNITRLEDLLQRLGYQSIDPGSLTGIEQLSLFVGKKDFVGLDGSQWFLAPLTDVGSTTSIIGHDLATDSRGRSWAIGEASGRSPNWFLGVRDFPVPGYGETIYHQNYSLSADTWEQLEHHLSSVE